MLGEILSRLSEIATIGASAEGFVQVCSLFENDFHFYTFLHFNLSNPISCRSINQVVRGHRTVSFGIDSFKSSQRNELQYEPEIEVMRVSKSNTMFIDFFHFVRFSDLLQQTISDDYLRFLFLSWNFPRSLDVILRHEIVEQARAGDTWDFSCLKFLWTSQIIVGLSIAWIWITE